MDSVFAPWRMDWITREKSDELDCVFCELPTQQADRKNRILVRSEYAYALLNKSPYTPGHILIVPEDHVGDIVELDGEVLSDVFTLLQTLTEAIQNELHPDGFNVGMNIGKAGGASIENHLHAHVVPRWVGDTTFMPTTANTKVLAEALDETYDRLYHGLYAIDGVEMSNEDRVLLVA